MSIKQSNIYQYCSILNNPTLNSLSLGFLQIILGLTYIYKHCFINAFIGSK